MTLLADFGVESRLDLEDYRQSLEFTSKAF
jgi:hypothetical protein